jgi:Rrf2 family iron-sulfur cluster assembly transcriptional regulator
MTHDLWEELSNHIHLFLSAVSLADVTSQQVLGMSGGVHRDAVSAP